MKRSPFKKRNPERLAKRRAVEFGRQAELCRELPCCVVGVDKYRGSTGGHLFRPAVPHHVLSRAAGGIDKDTVPLCAECHEEVHRIGRKSFEAKHGFRFIDVLAVLRRRVSEEA